MMRDMDPRRLELLLALCRLGSMRAVAETMQITTSTVSQQLAVLAREAGAPLIEPDGRRVRLTPAGRRLADHAVTILAAIEDARADLDPAAAPSGELRVAAFASAVRRSLLPVVASLAASHPDVRLLIHEHEPSEALDLLTADHIDLALIYDYNLAPANVDSGIETTPLWTTPWALAVPSDGPAVTGNALQVLAEFRDWDWIANSRNSADEDAARTVAALAGFPLRVAHRADSLELLEDLILAGLGVGLLPAERPPAPGVRLIPLHDPGIELRCMTAVRQGRARWPALALVLELLTQRRPITKLTGELVTSHGPRPVGSDGLPS